MLNEGGILVSASCSHHIQEDLFEEVLIQAAADNKRFLSLVHRGTQAMDHPNIPSIPETQYLKCFFFEVRHLS
jgi:23S rRNA (cytosine1962-C5)-methyltransferase